VSSPTQCSARVVSFNKSNCTVNLTSDSCTCDEGYFDADAGV